MKNNHSNVSYNQNILYVIFGDYSRKQTYFLLSQREITAVQSKVVGYGSLETYLEYLTRSYSGTIYNCFHKTKEEMNPSIGKKDRPIRFHCKIYSKTLRELENLANHTNASQTDVFRILMGMDERGWKPPLQIAA
ncbi:hypothetical protein LPTSP3_g29130 [Leptospira kobayashii]|uniref:Uncharacterized protein n=1 Tax=Leptospira kobayashii TaxID=1917830 RepID=A0ABM7ULV5_9LEPT|nr:hypothetical protein [Leptospira kobayashii]BDA79983.1 hypothetical protein LPTSP3_g29130 [Leptospira kobayashii]